MSAFTKFLIVLLTVFSIFLCGIVVTYVGSATNWKSEYQAQNDQIRALKSSLASEKKQAEKAILQANERVDKMLAENTELKAQKSELEVKVAAAERENGVHIQRISDSTGIIAGLRQTIEGQRTSLEATRSDLADKTSKLAMATKKLNELSDAFDEKVVEMGSLSVENRRLLEQKTDLEKMVAGGSVASMPEPVSAVRDNVEMISNQSVGYQSSDLKALISEVDLRNNLVTITIGVADGVSKGMRFHITRGSEFICDMVVTNVDQDRAAGVIELIQSSPRVGDNASTSL